MKFIHFLLFTTSIGYTAAVDLFLWKNPDACSGSGVVCVNQPPGRCCHEKGKLWGSGEARRPNHPGHDIAQLFSKRGDNYCAVHLGRPRPIPVCLVTGLESSVGGIAWENQGSKIKGRTEKRMEGVEGDPAYKDGDKVYVISKSKIKREGLVLPTDEKDAEAFFKKHADTVLDHSEEHPVEKVSAADATKEK